MNYNKLDMFINILTNMNVLNIRMKETESVDVGGHIVKWFDDTSQFHAAVLETSLYLF